MIETGQKTETVNFKEQILPSEDLSYKIELLNKHVDAFNENSIKFILLFYNIIVDEEQRGGIVESMIELVKEQYTQHAMYNSAVEEKNTIVVNKLDQVVEGNKTQKMSATYYVDKD